MAFVALLDVRAGVAEVVDQKAPAAVLRVRVASKGCGALGAAGLEDHLVDSATLVEGWAASAATGLGAPPVVVLPGRAGVAEMSVDEHLDDVVPRTVDEVDRQ